MNNKHQAILSVVLSTLLGVCFTSPLYADDIETIVGLTNDSAGANVMLVIDTSGSMGSEVLLNQDLYKPSIDYVGPFDQFEDDGTDPRMFYTLVNGNAIDYPDADSVNSLEYITSSRYVCESGLSVMASNGFYIDSHAQFDVNTGSWSSVVIAAADADDPQGQDQTTECGADTGAHGGQTGPDVYPINLDPVPSDPNLITPWSSDKNDTRRIDIADVGASYAFFSNNFLNWIHTHATDPSLEPVVQTRLEIVRAVAKNLTSDLKLAYENRAGKLNLGLMRFSQNGSGGMVLNPAGDITMNQAQLDAQIDTLTPQGNTPLSETMLEAKRYFAGEEVLYGAGSTPVTSTTDAILDDDITYESPIIAACQKNYVVLLTDGQPVGDFQANTEISSFAGDCTGNCLDELTQYMHTADFATGADFNGTQSVDTYIIGFFTDFDLLQDAATGVVQQYDDDGDPIDPPLDGYFLADDPSQLAEAFDLIFQGVESDVSAFTAPAVSVNSLNRLTNRDTLYFTMFEPAQYGEAHWDGNLKAYRIGRVGGTGDITILDAGGAQAVDDATGTFVSGATSVWSANPDGGDVTVGGMASRLGINRKVYSNIGGSSTLASDANRISTDNEDVIGPLVGLAAGSDDLDELIAYAQGLNADGDSRRELGDPLHSEPLIITYDGGPDDLLLVYGTNDGYIHAVNPEPDSAAEDLEEFAFIPRELLSQLKTLKANTPSDFPEDNKAYGMDGPISAWLKGDNGDFIVNSGEQLFVYAAMRRGGSSYYALDLTDRNDPKLAFTIDSSKAGYGDLGQTWSSVSYGKIKIDGSGKDVLIFGGGYDTNQDTSNGADTNGNAVFIADANSGDLLWSAGSASSSATLKLANMTHSIPADVRIIDINQDGYIDRMYVGDMGGQVWRFDISGEEDSIATAITGGLLAQLGGTGASNERRFHSAPSVSRFVDEGQIFLTVALGSGYRAHPLNTVNDDKFYVLRDNNVYGPKIVDGSPVYGDTDSDLLIVESDLIELNISNSTTADATGIPPGQFGKGWLLDLPNVGEKSLSPALTADGRIFFTTYSPETTTVSCEPTAASGTGRLYGIDILTGLPDLYGDADGGQPVLHTTLGPTGIPPAPKLVFTEPDCTTCDPEDQDLFSEVSLLTGSQVNDVDLSSNPVRTYWFQTDADGGE